MRKFLTLLCVITLVFSFSAIALSFSDFEEPIADTNYPLNPWVQYRDLQKSQVSVVDNVKWMSQGGHHSAELRLNTAGVKWLLLCKASWEGSATSLDTIFLPGLAARDTIHYYLWIPEGAPIDSIWIFERDSNYGHDDYKFYYPGDLNFGFWNELKSGISDSVNTNPKRATEFPLRQVDLEIHTTSGLPTPGCTLYFDCPSTIGSIIEQGYADTTGQGQAGVEMPGEGDGAVNVAKVSINCVEYAINVSAPVMVQVFDLAGRKQVQVAPGIQSANTYSLSLDLPTGVYLTKVTAGAEVAFGKVICVK